MIKTLPSMPMGAPASLGELYLSDETAWLDIMSELAAQARAAEMDLPHLSEYLADRARRDRREVVSRLVVLMTHLLKWQHQPQNRSGSWRGTIRAQRRELRELLESGTLQEHAQTLFAEAYEEARQQAADETELPLANFAVECTWSLEKLLDDEWPFVE